MNSSVYDFTEMMKMQEHLDDVIYSKKSVNPDSVRSNKLLALLTEVSELANECRSWKYWSEDRNPRIDVDGRDLVIEEYADCIHFALSLANDLGIEVGEVISQTRSTLELQFIGIYEKLSTFSWSVLMEDEISSNSKKTYFKFLEQLVGLGNRLGYSNEQVLQAYKNKNKINLERQDNGY